MNVDALEELVGWPDNGNTFLASGPDGMRLAVAPADVGEEIGMMAALDWAYAKYGGGVHRFGRTGLAPAPLARMSYHGLRRLDRRRGKVLRRAVGRPARRSRAHRGRNRIGVRDA